MKSSEELIDDLGSPAPAFAAAAKAELASRGIEALPALLDGLEANGRSRSAIAGLLVDLGPPAVAGLIQACGHPSEQVRSLAAWALSHLA